MMADTDTISKLEHNYNSDYCTYMHSMTCKNLIPGNEIVLELDIDVSLEV